MPKILATADLHGNLPEIPECDILLIGGDICPDYDVMRQFEWLMGPFRNWLNAVPAKRIVAIAGNHDFLMENPVFDEAYLKWCYLRDSQVEINGVSIYGTPWVPNLPSWAFHASKEGLHEHYLAIPKGTDIVLSHGPPHGYGDRVRVMHAHEATPHVGTKSGMDMIKRVRPKAMVCGHIHEGFGQYRLNHDVPDTSHTEIYNVSYVDEYYTPRKQIIEIDLGDDVMNDNAQQEQEEPHPANSAVHSSSTHPG